MKNCNNCGSENVDDATHCQECDSPFSLQAATSFNIKPWVKWVLYSGAWGVVIISTLARNPADMLTAPAFPIGFLAVFPGAIMTIAVWFFAPIVIGLGWTMYGMLTYVMKTTGKSGVFFLTYIIFCVLLTLNAIGCRMVTATIGGIH